MSGRTKLARKRLAEWMAEAPSERSQTSLGALFGVSQSAVGQWLAGETRPAERLRKAIEALTGIEASAWETVEERREREALERRLRDAAHGAAQS